MRIHGLRIYGTPWVPQYRDMAFSIPRGQALKSKWDLIPDDTDILVTHAPPLGIGDTNGKGEKSGCLDLLQTVRQRVQPKFHIFGHIHECKNSFLYTVENVHILT